MDKAIERLEKNIETDRQRGRAIGAILVEQGRLKLNDIDDIQRYAKSHDLRFGDAAVIMQRATQEDVDSAIAQQYNYPILTRGGDGVSEDVIAGYLPQHKSVEPLRALRSQLVLRWLNNTDRGILSVISPDRGEGRSWIAANLATMFAQLGERTLLIDADMRNPRQHQLFNLDNSVGLSALVTGRAGREIAKRIHSQLRLFVIPAGVSPPNPQELLSRPVFDVVLDHFSRQFSVVIIDTPAISEAADAQILAVNAGSAILLARRNHTKQSALVAAMDTLVGSGVNVVGSVINEH